MELNEYYKKIKQRVEEKKEQNAPGFFSVIPVFILEDNRLTATEKIIFSEISALTNRFGFCYATSKHFRNTLGVSRSTMKRSFKKLKDLNYIKVEIEKSGKGTVRKVWITCG